MSTESQRLARAVYDELRACGVRHIVGVPDRETAALWQCFAEDQGAKVITACREGEAVGICGGLHLAGRRALYCVKNFGFFEALDTYRMLAVDAGTPLIAFVGFAGRPRPGGAQELRARLGEDAASQVLLAGRWTEDILKAIDVPAYVLEALGDVPRVRQASDRSLAESRPVVLLGELP